MHARCDNHCKPGADGGTILGQPMLFECVGICVLIPAHECEMRGSLVYLLIVKILISSTLFQFSRSMLDWTTLSWNLLGFVSDSFRRVCGPYHLQGLYSESELIYLL